MPAWPPLWACAPSEDQGPHDRGPGCWPGASLWKGHRLVTPLRGHRLSVSLSPVLRCGVCGPCQLQETAAHDIICGTRGTMERSAGLLVQDLEESKTVTAYHDAKHRPQSQAMTLALTARDSCWMTGHPPSPNQGAAV